MAETKSGKRITESFAIEADAIHLDGMVHKVDVGDVGEQTFTFHSDEGPALGGRDEYPWPLHYLIAGIAF